MTHADTAAKLVLGDRNNSYGTPADDFTEVGLMWTGLLRRHLAPNYVIPPEMVALMMVALKIRRESHQPKDDNVVDAAGYLLCLEWIKTGQRPEPHAQILEQTLEDVATGARPPDVKI